MFTKISREPVGVRCWRDGRIPDIGEAVDSPRRLTSDPELAQGVLELIRDVPTPVWGRDELGTGDMWNSNSVVSWVIVRSGLDSDAIHPPRGGRAPGRDAGLLVARMAGSQGERAADDECGTDDEGDAEQQRA